MELKSKIPRYVFDRKDYELIRLVNEVLQAPRVARKLYFPYFHPNGIKEMVETRGLRSAFAVAQLLSSLEIGGVEDRLNALRSLRLEVIDAAQGPMPKNTARVLLQIMKELVRAFGDQRRQLELAHDFRMTASGKPRLIRRELKRHHLLEMPEEWNQIAFDDHVHDANTKGRKTPTHLIMDAWIKGIRRLRVIYYNFIEPRFAAELFDAARHHRHRRAHRHRVLRPLPRHVRAAHLGARAGSPTRRPSSASWPSRRSCSSWRPGARPRTISRGTCSRCCASSTRSTGPT